MWYRVLYISFRLRTIILTLNWMGNVVSKITEPQKGKYDTTSLTRHLDFRVELLETEWRLLLSVREKGREHGRWLRDEQKRFWCSTDGDDVRKTSYTVRSQRDGHHLRGQTAVFTPT